MISNNPLYDTTFYMHILTYEKTSSSSTRFNNVYFQLKLNKQDVILYRISGYTVYFFMVQKFFVISTVGFVELNVSL